MPHATATETAYSDHKLFVDNGELKVGQYAQLKPTAADTPMDEVRRQYAEDGYVFMKGLLPREDVLGARRQYFQLLAPSGVLKPGTEPVEGIFDLEKDSADFPGIGAGTAAANGRPSGLHPEIAEKFVDLALQAHTEDWYKEVFCKHPALLDFVERMTGWGKNTLGIRRTLLRNNTPGNKAIGVHYDQIFVRHGEDSILTAWVPIGDVKVQGGGLIYLENGKHVMHLSRISLALNRSQIRCRDRTSLHEEVKESGMTDEESRDAFNQNMMSGVMLADGPTEFGKQNNRRWLVTNYEAGDVVFHNAYAIHASTMNYDEEGVIRLGTDLRFVDSSKRWNTRWSRDYEFGDGV